MAIRGRAKGSSIAIAAVAAAVFGIGCWGGDDPPDDGDGSGGSSDPGDGDGDSGGDDEGDGGDGGSDGDGSNGDGDGSNGDGDGSDGDGDDNGKGDGDDGGDGGDGGDGTGEKKLVLEGYKSIDHLQDGYEGNALADWEIEVYGDATSEDPAFLGSATTDAYGAWKLELGHLDPGERRDLAVCEVQYVGWEQTFPGNGDRATIEIDGRVCHHVEVSASRDPHAEGEKLRVSELDFANVAHHELSGYKYFDRLMEGVRSQMTPGIEGWRVKIFRDGELHCTVATDEDGAWSSDDLDVHTGKPCPPLEPGDYEIAEVLPENDRVWTQTGNVAKQGDAAERDYVYLDDYVYEVYLPGHTPHSIGDMNFGNVCFKNFFCDVSRYIPQSYSACEAPEFESAPR